MRVEISPTRVLTAAHCFDTVHTKDVRLVLGSSNVQDENEYWRQVRTVLSLDIHPKYDNKYAYYDYVCLPQSFQRDADTLFGFLAGWGSQSKRTPPSDHLRLVHLNIFEQFYCDLKYRRSQTTILPDLFKTSVFCAGYAVWIGLVLIFLNR